MEMEPFSSNHKRGLTRSRSLPPRMEIGDSSNIGYGQFSAEVVDTSRIKSHSQEISSQTDPHMDRFLSDDLENNKDSLEKSYPKDRFQETIPPSEYPIGENMSAIEGRAPDLYPLNRENSSVIEQDQGEFYAAPPSIRDVGHQSHSGDCPRRRRPVSPPLRSRFEVQDYAEYYAEGYAGPYYYVYDDIAATSTTYTTSTTATTSADDFENDNNANTANLARPKPGDIKNTNQETLSKEKDNRAISAQLDDVNYTRASNVTLSNFVSVKLSGKSNYDMWKAQMVCLMKSHKMRGLVIKDKELPDNKDTELRERYEILLNGWLIGSLSEEIIKDKRIYNKGAKGIWDTLEQSYDPYAISPTASTLLKPREEKEKQGTGIELKLIKKLHNATLEGHWWKAKSILNECQGAATWEINVNHDTLLHVAVRLGNNYFLEKMLDIIQTEKEIEKANSEGHTALHTAAIVGNKEAAELLVEKNKKLLSMKDNDSKIPLACANLNKQVNVFVYLWRVTDESDRKGSLSENKEKENENEKDKDKRKEKENEEEKEKEEGKLKENEKENQIKKEKEIENENENEKDKRKERVNEKEKRIEEGKEDENEKEKGKKEGKGNEIEKEKGKGIVNKNEKVKEEEQEGQVQSLLNTAIHDKQYDLAMELVKIYPNLAKQPSTLVVLTRNFPSQISFGETLMYPSLNDVCHKLVKRSFLLLHSLEYLYARAGETLWKMRRAVRDNKTEKPKLYGFRRFKNKYYYSLFPELVISFFVSCAVPAAVLYLIYRLLCLLILLLRLPFSMLYFILWKVLAFLVVPIKNIEKKRKEHKEAKKFLKLICRQNSLKAKNSKDSPFDKFYKESLMEAACLDVHEVLDQILKLSSNAMKVKNKDGHNIIQLAVINRSAEVYNLLTPIIEGKGSYRKVMDVFRNNLLHLAGRLAPLAVLSCTSGAALQLQRELQWREEVKKLMEPTQHTKENVDYETPEMVFSREHANLVKEGEKWMKTTAESCSITAALIITIVFAAAITVPGGSNQVTGIPLFKRKFAFNIFAVADAISLFLASTSLLVFLSILTTRFAEKDFLISLPRRLFIGLCLLFLSTTAMMLAFSTILFLVFCEERPWMLAPIGGLTCFPIAAIVTLQLPLVNDLYQATSITIFDKENREEEEDDEEEDKEKLNEEVDNKKQAKKEEEKQKIQNIERDDNSILKRLSRACCLPLREKKPIPKRSSANFSLPLHQGNL